MSVAYSTPFLWFQSLVFSSSCILSQPIWNIVTTLIFTACLYMRTYIHCEKPPSIFGTVRNHRYFTWCHRKITGSNFAAGKWGTYGALLLINGDAPASTTANDFPFSIWSGLVSFICVYKGNRFVLLQCFLCVYDRIFTCFHNSALSCHESTIHIYHISHTAPLFMGCFAVHPPSPDCSPSILLCVLCEKCACSWLIKWFL